MPIANVPTQQRFPGRQVLGKQSVDWNGSFVEIDDIYHLVSRKYSSQWFLTKSSRVQLSSARDNNLPGEFAEMIMHAN
jgi:hypothetical protein